MELAESVFVFILMRKEKLDSSAPRDKAPINLFVHRKYPNIETPGHALVQKALGMP